MRISAKDIKVGMIVRNDVSELEVLELLPDQYQKNGKRLIMVSATLICNYKKLTDYSLLTSSEDECGHWRESTKIDIVNRSESKYFNN